MQTLKQTLGCRDGIASLYFIARFLFAYGYHSSCFYSEDASGTVLKNIGYALDLIFLYQAD